MQANTLRHIKSGNQYNKYFTPADFKNTNWAKADVMTTLELMAKIVTDTKNQTKAIAQVLKGDSLLETTNNIWNFLYDHVQYKLDDQGLEQLRSPNRLWADRKTGVDCDCYSITISSILTNLNIPHSLRIAEYSHKGYYQHVYVVVPISKNSFITIDPVLDQFNEEKTFTKKHDKIMIQHQFLSGTEDYTPVLTFGNEFNELAGLGMTDPVNAEQAFLNSAKKHLLTTLAMIEATPERYEGTVNTEVLAEQITYALENWDNPISRNAVLEELSEMAELGEDKSEVTKGVNGFDEFQDEFSALDGFATVTIQRLRANRNSRLPAYSQRLSMNRKSNSKALEKVKALKLRRRKQKQVVPATIRRKTLHRAPELLHLTQGKQITLKISLNGFFGNMWNKIKSGASSVAAAAKRAAAAVAAKAKTAALWAKNKASKAAAALKAVAIKAAKLAKEKALQAAAAIKKAGAWVVAHNPISWAIKKALFYALKFDIFKMASRLKMGYYRVPEAKAKGLDLREHAKVQGALRRVKAMYTTMGGNPDDLKKAILSGRAGALNGLGDPVTLAAAAVPAAGIIAKIVSFLKGIDFKKLIAKVKGLIPDGIKDIVAKGKEVYTRLDARNLNPILPKTVIKDGNTSKEVDDSFTKPSVDTGEYAYVDPNKPADKPKETKSNTGLYIGLAVGVAAIGGLAYANSQKGKKSLNGVQEVTI